MRRLQRLGVLFLAAYGALSLIGAGTTLLGSRQTVSETVDQRALLLSLTNGDRESAGLAPLLVLPSIDDLAQWRSEDMANRGYFSHDIPPSGEIVFAVMSQQGIQYAVAGENIGENNFPVEMATYSIEQGFMSSPDHRANILGDWKYIGVGYAVSASGERVWTVLFLKPLPAATPAPLPVPRPTRKPTPTAPVTPRPTPITCGA